MTILNRMLLSYFCFSISIMSLLVFGKNAAAEPNRFDVKEFGAVADGRTDDAPAFHRAVAAAKKHAAENDGAETMVFVPGGNYRLETLAPGNKGYLSIVKMSRFTIQGEADTLLVGVDPTKHFFDIVDSNRITVRQFKIDRDPLVFTQGTIDAIDIAAQTVDVTIDPGYDEPDSKYIAPMKPLLVFTDPKAQTWDHSRWWPNIDKRERIKPMKWRFTLHISPLETYLGKKFIIWKNLHHGWAMNIFRCDEILAEDIAYYGSGADAGFTCWNNGDLTFRRFSVGIPPGSNRLFASAGGSHAMQNRGTFTVEDCDFAWLDDDSINNGTTAMKVHKQVDAKTLLIEEHTMPLPYHKGDTIAIWDWFDKKERSRAKLVDFERYRENDKTFVRMTLDAEMKVLHPVGGDGLPSKADWNGKGRFEENDGIDRVVDLETAGKMIIRGCRFQNMRARNVLIKTMDSVIENNTFYNTHMCSILVGPEFYWAEAPAVENLVIRNNRFTNIDGSCINIGCHHSEKSRDNKSIVIEGNTFEHYGAVGGVGISGRQGTAVLIRNVDGAIVRNNDFGRPAPAAPDSAQPLVVESSENVVIENNRGL